jgi:hypothetical protein
MFLVSYEMFAVSYELLSVSYEMFSASYEIFGISYETLAVSYKLADFSQIENVPALLCTGATILTCAEKRTIIAGQSITNSVIRDIADESVKEASYTLSH